MVNYSWRFFKRFAVLIPGIFIAYVSVRSIFPYFDKRLPLGVAILVTYILGAYVLIPATLRLWRIIVPAKHLPLYCITPDGYASDPLNIGLIGTREQLVTAMEAIGWHMAGPYTPWNIALAVTATVLKRSYHKAPMSALYLFGRKQDIGFELQLPEAGRGHRQHVRFWATTFDSVEQLSANVIHWSKYQKQPTGDRLLWVGAASRDVGVSFIRHTVQVTHMIDPDTNSERDFIVQQLKDQDCAKPAITVQLQQPYRLANRAWRGYLHTDGRMEILRLNIWPTNARKL
jgi:hypothetical protein